MSDAEILLYWQQCTDAARAERDRCREALEFYANPVAYGQPIALSPIWADRGAVASAALSRNEVE